MPPSGWSHTSESNSQPLAQRVSDYFEKIRPVLSVYSCMNWARNNSSEFTIKETRGNWSKMCPAIVSGIATRWGCAGQLMVLFRPQPPPPPPHLRSPVTVPEVFRSFSFLKWPLLTKGFIASDSTAYNSHTLPGDSPYYPWRAHRKLRDAYLWGGNLDPLITLRTLFWYSWSVYNLNNKRPGQCKEFITIFIFIEFTTVNQYGGRGWNRTYVPIKYQTLQYPPNPWKVVSHHRGLRPLLFTNGSIGSFTSHKNENSKRAVRRAYGSSSLPKID